jgi:hypothetical protein
MKSFNPISPSFFLTLERPLLEFNTSFLLNMKGTITEMLNEKPSTPDALFEIITRLGWETELEQIKLELIQRN